MIIRRMSLLLVVAVAVFGFYLTWQAAADATSSTFDALTDGDISGQGGWHTSATKFYAEVVSGVGNGGKALQFANKTNSGSFGDQASSPDLKELAAAPFTADGTPTGRVHNVFEVEFDFKAVSNSADGSRVEVGPHGKGDGSSPGNRTDSIYFYNYHNGSNSWSGDFVTDEVNPDGVAVRAFFANADASVWTGKYLATGLSRTDWHTFKAIYTYRAGPENDTVEYFINGESVGTYAPWGENYFYNAEQSKFPGASRMLFRSNSNTDYGSKDGFYFDNLSYSTYTDVPNELYVDDDKKEYPDADYTSIADAVADAQDGATIYVAPGTYAEQVLYEGKSLTIQGDINSTAAAKAGAAATGKPVIEWPDVAEGDLVALVKSARLGAELKPIVGVNDGSLTINNVVVDGLNKGNSKDRHYIGICAYESNISMNNVDVKNIVDEAHFGNQTGLSIYAENHGDDLLSFELTNSTVPYFQKNAVTVNGYPDKADYNWNVTITGNTITGIGPTDKTAQNGIQVQNVTGVISGNTVTEIGWTGEKWVASGLLLYLNNNLTVSDNILTDCQASVFHYVDDTVSVSGNTVTMSGADKAEYDGNPDNVGTYGVYNYASSGVAFSGNSIGGFTYGNLLYQDTGSSVTGDSFDANEVGVSVYESTTLSLTANTVTNSTTNGIEMVGSASTAPASFSAKGGQVEHNGIGLDRKAARKAARGVSVSINAEISSFMFNCLSGNATGLNVGTAVTAFSAQYTYWGAVDGPGGDGPGSGDSLTDPHGSVTLDGFLPTCDSGVVQLSIEPASAVAQTAGVSIDNGNTFYNDGDIIIAEAGVYNPTYGNTADWNGPDSETITVPSKEVASKTITFTRATGTVTVNLLPAVANANGISWSVDGSTYASGETVALETGTYTLTPNGNQFWTAPAAVQLVVANGGVYTQDFTFTQTTGTIVVNAGPDSLTGGQWFFFGQNEFHAFGTPVDFVPWGDYFIEFTDVDNFGTPDPVAVTIEPGEVLNITVLYEDLFADTGSVTVTTNNGGQWRPVADGALPAASTFPWFDSGATVRGLTPGPIGIEFRPVPGYITREQITIEVELNGVTSTEVEYTRPFVAHTSDFDGNGTADLATFDTRTRTWSIASVTGLAPSAKGDTELILERKFGKASDVQVPGDYDGDGIADLATYNAKQGKWKILGNYNLKNFDCGDGEHDVIPVPGDYSGDGMTQPAIYCAEEGLWKIYDHTTRKISEVQFGEPLEVPVPGNWDGSTDGSTDLGLYHVDSGIWRVAVWKEKKGKYVIKGKLGTKNFGQVGDVPVHGDYDGDGKTDAALYRPSANLWLTNGILDDLEHGVEGDIPMAADWAGLGRVLPSIFRPRNGLWLSFDNLLNTRFGAGTLPLNASGR